MGFSNIFTFTAIFNGRSHTFVYAWYMHNKLVKDVFAVADQGFPVGGGVDSRGGYVS